MKTAPEPLHQSSSKEFEVTRDEAKAVVSRTAAFAHQSPAPPGAISGVPIGIQLSPLVMVGIIHNRQDLVVSGLATAEQPITGVSLLFESEVRALALYPRLGGRQQAFQLSLVQRNDLIQNPVTFEVLAQIASGEATRSSFMIAIDRDDPRSAHVIEGPIIERPIIDKPVPPILLYVEVATIERGRVLHVRGWCVAQTQIVTIRVLANEQRLGIAQYGQLRDDIAAAFPTYPNSQKSGFTLTSEVGEGKAPEFVVVEAIDLSGSVNRVTVPLHNQVTSTGPDSEGVADSRRRIFFHCDSAVVSGDSVLTLSGWAVCATGVSGVVVPLGKERFEADLGLLRPDVAEQFKGIPQAQFSGFRLEARIDAPISTDIKISVRNGLDDVRIYSVPVAAVASNSAELHVANDPIEDFRLELDNPVVINGAASDPVIGRLVIEGWALARSGIENIEVFIDGNRLGEAYYGTARRDVEAAFPDWDNALRCGYIFHCPPQALPQGNHLVRLLLKTKNNRTCHSEFRIDVQKSDDAEEYATIRRHLSRAEIDLYQDMVGRLGHRPAFRLVMPIAGRIFDDEIEVSLRALTEQAYRDWHLTIVASKSKWRRIRRVADRVGVTERIILAQPNATLDIFVPRPAVDAPCLVGVLCPGDELGADSLAEIAIACGQRPAAQLFYADEDRVSPASSMREPFFKPAWSPDLLLSTNYIGRPWFASFELFRRAGVTTETLLADQGDYDAVLRCTEMTSAIHHLPKLLCRRHESNHAEQNAEPLALRAATVRRGIEARVLAGCVPGTWRLKRTTPARGMVSIIIPTCGAQGHVEKCLDTLRRKTAYPNFEIICIDNIPPSLPQWKDLVHKHADKVVEISESFNWSRFNNHAAEKAAGEYFLFLNDDIEVQQSDWLDVLLEHAQRPEVGVVGPQLVYPDRKVQHAGIFLTNLGAGRHSFRFLAEDDPGYFGLALTQRNVMAVTGACMLMRREVFDRIGRFDEAHQVVNNDVDCCLRAWQAGLSVIYTPHAQLIHHELASRATIKDIYDAGHFARQWRSLYAAGDPYFSPRLTKFADEYRPDTEPVRAILARRPLFHIGEIRRILAMKLDHIGDLLTAIPALRRLRQLFPRASIYLLSAGAAKSFLTNQDCVSEVIEFEFFHARSGLGEKGVTEDDLRGLTSRLAPYRFDLAIDLRKQVETRHILRYIPARFRAGYNHLGRFPWLDIALEWEGDNQLRRKASHISDDLLRLVDAVATAGAVDHAILPAPTGIPKLPEGLPAGTRELFLKPVVAVHPGVGAIMRQWPPEYFASVIDLLIEKNDVNVAVIGGNDEVELAHLVLEAVVNREHVVSLAGRTTLAELTELLSACALYLGNNSGPKHIAAALSVPTVGIHSGVVDAAEWAPMGPRAIALQKNMVCSPCYLVQPDDCVRGMACLTRLEPAVVHQYCEMMLARRVPAAALMNVASSSPANNRATDATKSTMRLRRRSAGVLVKHHV